MGWEVTDRRIYYIKYHHKSKDYEAKVGKKSDYLVESHESSV